MWVFKKSGSLSTTLYRKETDTNTILHTCETAEDYTEKAKDMKDRFVQRGYPIEWIDKAYKTALRKPRPDLLKKGIFCNLHYLLLSSLTYNTSSF